MLDLGQEFWSQYLDVKATTSNIVAGLVVAFILFLVTNLLGLRTKLWKLLKDVGWAIRQGWRAYRARRSGPPATSSETPMMVTEERPDRDLDELKAYLRKPLKLPTSTQPEGLVREPAQAPTRLSTLEDRLRGELIDDVLLIRATERTNSSETNRCAITVENRAATPLKNVHLQLTSLGIWRHSVAKPDYYPEDHGFDQEYQLTAAGTERTLFTGKPVNFGVARRIGDGFEIIETPDKPGKRIHKLEPGKWRAGLRLTSAGRPLAEFGLCFEYDPSRHGLQYPDMPIVDLRKVPEESLSGPKVILSATGSGTELKVESLGEEATNVRLVPTQSKNYTLRSDIIRCLKLESPEVLVLCCGSKNKEGSPVLSKHSSPALFFNDLFPAYGGEDPVGILQHAMTQLTERQVAVELEVAYSAVSGAEHYRSAFLVRWNQLEAFINDVEPTGMRRDVDPPPTTPPQVITD